MNQIIDGGATEADGGASAPVGLSVATPLQITDLRISLISICCKILEHIIYSGISHHLEEHNVIRNEQHGFRSGCSCETQLLITIHDFANNK